MRPKRSTAACTIASTRSPSRTSTAKGSARRPSASTSLAVEWMVPGSAGSSSTLLAATKTSQPSLASPSASARPTPRLAPVITAARPWKRIGPL